MNRVLLIEDGPAERLLLRRILRDADFEVTEASTGEEAMSRLGDEGLAVVLLDIGLPDVDGFELLQRLVQADVVPVIVVTGRAEEDHRVRGLTHGAADYVVKPFLHQELVARVANVIRRERPRLRQRMWQFPGLGIDAARSRLTGPRGEVPLTPRELQLLLLLVEADGRPIGRDELLHQVWNSRRDWQSPATVTEHIYRLRTKCKTVGVNSACIRTSRSDGYSFDGSLLTEHEADADDPDPSADHDRHGAEIRASDAVRDAFAALLNLDDPAEVTTWLINTVSCFGASLVDSDDPEALPFDLSLGRGRPVFVKAPRDPHALACTKKYLPRLIEHARLVAERAK